MRVVALVSGGKDSCFNMMHCVALGHEIVALANLHPPGKEETDSFMYQTVGQEGITLYSQAMNVPLYRREISGGSVSTDLTYIEDKRDEVEDLYLLLKSIKEEMEFDAISSGAILSDYQRIRVENVCSRLGLVSMAYLWRKDQSTLMDSMIENNLHSILIKTAGIGLKPHQHLGKTLQQMRPTFHKLYKLYGSHICGEGGEYETFTLDCPLFKKRIVIDESEVVIHSDDDLAPVGYLRFSKMHLEEKTNNECSWNKQDLSKALREDLEIPTEHYDASLQIDCEKQELVSLPNDLQSINKEPTINVLCKGDFLSVCGVSGSLSSSNDACEDSVRACAEECFSRLVSILNDNDHQQRNVFYVHLFIANMAHFSVINPVYKTMFYLNPPARVCVSVDFNGKQQENSSVALQVDCLSYKGTETPQVMHVQSKSHWAPANIGPYSQCVSLNNNFFIAGQIGMIPCSLDIVHGGAFAEACLSLNHVKTVFQVMNTQLTYGSFVQLICYCTSVESVRCAVNALHTIADANESPIPSALYVVIPSLPKNALVEWQSVMRLENDEDFKRKSLFCYTEPLINQSLSDIIDYFYHSVEKELSDNAEKYHNVSLIHGRFFYSFNNVPSTYVSKCCSEISRNYHELPLNITAVPVERIIYPQKDKTIHAALSCLFL